MTEPRITVTAWLFFGIAVLTIADAFLRNDALVLATAILIVAFIVAEFTSVPRAQQIAGIALLAMGTAAAFYTGKLPSLLFDGVARSRTFLVLFFAVAWLQPPVSQSPALKATRATIVSQPPGRRFAFLTVGVHILGSVLNLAGLGLLTTIVEKPGTDPALRKRLTLALMQGFTSASCWSPFYIGTIVVLVAVPALSWGDLAPWGITMAGILMFGSWAMARVGARRTSGPSDPPSHISLKRGTTLRTIGILAALIGIVMMLVEALDVSIPVILGIVGPPFGLIWFASHRSATRPFATLSRRVTSGLPRLRNETLVFVAANVFGVGIGTLIPSENMAELLNRLLPWTDMRILALIGVFIATSAIGLHPVIVVVSLSAILPPTALGLPDLIVGLTYMGCWGLSTMISPISGTTLFMSRATGVPSHIIGWQWAPPVVFLSAGLVAAMVISLRHLLF